MILIILIAYVFLLSVLLISSGKREIVKPQNKKTKFSIIVPFRNEEKNLEGFINGIVEQDYPRDAFELVLVNDASSDNGEFICNELLKQSGIAYRILKNEIRLGKKSSISKAVDSSKYEFIITRDADTENVSKNWLASISDYLIQTNKKFVILPVISLPSNSLISMLQFAESIALKIITGGSANLMHPILCSGANLCYHRKYFETNPYLDNVNIESGDDTFLLKKALKVGKGEIGYFGSFEVNIITKPNQNLYDMFKQKVRWAKKLTREPLSFNSLFGLFLIIVNVTTLISWVLLLMHLQKPLIPLIFLISKHLIDILLVFLAPDTLKWKFNIVYLVLAALIYPFYTLSVFLLSVFGYKTEWKN